MTKISPILESELSKGIDMLSHNHRLLINDQTLIAEIYRNLSISYMALLLIGMANEIRIYLSNLIYYKLFTIIYT